MRKEACVCVSGYRARTQILAMERKNKIKQNLQTLIKSAEIQNPVLFSLLLTLIISYHDASCNHRKIMKRSQW